MVDYSNLVEIIWGQFSDTEKAVFSAEQVDHIVYLYHELQANYEHNVFDKVHHVDLFFQQGFESYVSSAEICSYIQNELEKDAIYIEEKFISGLVESIKNYYRNLND
jgi:LytS/YehU family sensor histidine kinase